MRFKERNELANRCKEWIKDQIENNITMPLDTVHMVLAYLDVNGYLNEVVRCKDCVYWEQATDNSGNCNRAFEITAYGSDYCSYAERREDAN